MQYFNAQALIDCIKSVHYLKKCFPEINGGNDLHIYALHCMLMNVKCLFWGFIYCEII